MNLMKEGTFDLLTEEAHVKDAVSRVVVEMIKREWPQHWPSLISDLLQLCSMGPTQDELVLLIFLRLTEDVLVFQSLSQHQRRREIVQALSENFPVLFQYFTETLKTRYQAYKSFPESDNSMDKLINCQVARAVLMTLPPFLTEWVPISYLTSNGGQLLELFCLMLSDPSLQIPAAECLLAFTGRKGKHDDRKPILLLFSEAAMQVILDATRVAAQAVLSEHHYNFLKRMCNVLTSLGSQLAVLWGACDTVGEPSNFLQYLEAVLEFTKHPSQTLGSYTHGLWASFLKHQSISSNATFQACIPVLIQTTRQTLLKVGIPSLDNSPSCAYSRLDFDCDEDFKIFFSRYRAEISDTIRLSTALCPVTCFQFTANWLDEQLRKPLDIGEATSHCNLSSPSFVEWDALTVCLENVMVHLRQTGKAENLVQDGTKLLKDCLAFQSQDPLILSCLLSLISALFPFVTHSPDVLPIVLEKIFSSAVFNLEGQTKATRSKAVKNVRRHACSCLVKICKQSPDLLLPSFNELYSHIKKISDDPEGLSQMEKCTLIEALLLINNRFADFERQSQFIGEILVPVKEIWLAEKMRKSLWSCGQFLSYVGLDQPAVEPSSEDTCGINRSEILYCVTMILAVLKRSIWPEDMEQAKTGKFVAGQTASGDAILCNPATRHLIGTFDNVLALIRTLNVMWFAENLQKRHPDFAEAYSMMDVDKQQVLGIRPPSIDNTDSMSSQRPLERMQSFLNTVHSTSHHILGNAGQFLGLEFYQSPSLTTSLLNSIFVNLENNPNFRLRHIIRIFLKPFVQFCPPCSNTAETLILPLLQRFAPFIQARLDAAWQVLNVNTEEETAVGQGGDQESQEVLEEYILRQLSREYIEFLVGVFRERKIQGVVDDAMDDGDAPAPQPSQKEDKLSDLGQTLLSSPSLYSSIVLTLFGALQWKDTAVCGKTISTCWPVTQQLISNNVLENADVMHLFNAVLNALHIHGQHEAMEAAIVALLLQFYEKLRPQFPGLRDIMLSIPSCQEDKLNAFEEKLCTASGPKQFPEKKRKETFKKLVQDAVGKNIGAKFKSDIYIKNLPSVKRQNKPAPASLDEIEQGDIGLCSLFTPSQE